MSAAPEDAAPRAAAGAEPTLEAHGLGFGYAGHVVFSGVSLAVHPREIVCLLGQSGCGKSSLLRVLAGLARPERGSVRMLGQALEAPHPRSALVFQQPSLLPWLDVAQNVGFGLDFKRQPTRADKALRARRVERAVAAVGLSGRERAFPAQLSGGMGQRVALARALAREPLLLFADEPFSALDAITRVEMQNLLTLLVQRWQSAALLVTHDLDEAIRVADRVLLMGERGQGASILREWRVDIQRPRDDHPERTLALRLDMLDALRHLGRARALTEN
jgi:NitT/TauT family transport system ATP-binding protein